jgi:Zn finger protein HypA/HybF involved in hydrogenase expression
MLARDTRNSRHTRRCLKCDRSFVSKHRFNRLCENCVKQNASVNYGEYVLHGGISSLRPVDERE